MSEIPVLRATILEQTGLVRGAMSTRLGGVSRPPFGMNLSLNVGDDPADVSENRRRFLSTLGAFPGHLAFPRQVHSTTVRPVTEAGPYSDCDALISATPGLVLAVTVADCVPVLMLDRRRSAIAAVHAGWRGTAAGIVPAAVARMHTEFGTLPGDLVAWIGPSASVCCYAVGEDVASQFPAVMVGRRGGELFVDLKAANCAALEACGVPSHSIETSPLCTISESHLLHSYRRDGDASGRMMAALILASP